MARPRDRFGRFLKRKKATRNPRKYSAKRRSSYAAAPRRRKAKRNPYFTNAPSKRRYSRKRYARHNPAFISSGGILGLSFRDIGYAGIGFIAPPAIEGLLRGMLPTALTSNKFGKYAVKGGIVAGLSLIGGKFLGREAGKYIAIGGATYLVASLVVDFVPQLFGGFGSYMNPGRTFQPASMRAAPLLGKYTRGVAGMGTASSRVGLPSRLDSAGRL